MLDQSQIYADVQKTLVLFEYLYSNQNYQEAFSILANPDSLEESLYYKLKSLGMYDEVIQSFAKLLERWQPVKWEYSLAMSLLGDTYRLKGKKHKALSCFNKSLKIAIEIEDLDGQAGSLINIGLIYCDLGEYQNAIKFLHRGLFIVRQLDNEEFEGNALNHLGLVLKEVELYDFALDYYYHALKIFQKLELPANESGTLINIGDVYHRLKNYDLAIAYLDNGIELAKLAQSVEFEGNGWHILGLVYKDISESPNHDFDSYAERSKDAFEKAETIFRRIGLDLHAEDSSGLLQEIIDKVITEDKLSKEQLTEMFDLSKPYS